MPTTSARDRSNRPQHRPTRDALAAVRLLVRSRWATLLGVACRTALRTLIAFASVAAIGVLGAAVLVDWFAPTAGPSTCRQVALPLLVMVAALAVIGLIGTVVTRVTGHRGGDTS